MKIDLQKIVETVRFHAPSEEIKIFLDFYAEDFIEIGLFWLDKSSNMKHYKCTRIYKDMHECIIPIRINDLVLSFKSYINYNENIGNRS